MAGAKTLYLVDGTSQLFRAYYAIHGLSNAEGLPTGAVYGFTSMLRKLIQDEQPPYLGVAFDLGGAVFRHAEFAEYKANRRPTPEDLDVQAPYARQVCEVLGIPVLSLAGYEADDLIATFARRGREAGFEVVVVASDKDLLQLVGDGISVLNPTKRERLDAAGVERSFGVPPERVVDVLGLMGDSVDNIPGVPGVGQKTAQAIVSTYGPLDDVLDRARRFVAAYDARDALVEAIESAAANAAALREAAGRAASALAELAGGERDADLAERLAAAREALASAAPAAPSGGDAPPGATARDLARLKRELKALDRGSSRRAWYAIHENAQQARLSKRLATLDDGVALPFDAALLARRGPDRERARALFDALDFRALGAELAGAGEGSGTGSEEESGAATRVEVVHDPARLRAIAEACDKAGRVALVARADGGGALRSELVGLALAWEPGGGVYVPLGHDYLGAPAQAAAAEVIAALGPTLARARPAKTAHDLKRHGHVLRRAGLPVEGWGLDPRVAAFLLDPGRSSYGVERLAREYLQLDLPDEDGLLGSGAKRRRVAEVGVEEVAALAVRHAVAVLGLAEQLPARLEQAGLADVYRRIDGPLLPLLARMERRGIRVDAARLEAMSVEMQSALEGARAEIHRLAGTEFNVDSPKQLREVLFERLGLKTRRRTAKGREASTDAQALEELAPDHAIARAILEYRELAKLKGTYVDALPRMIDPETGRVHTRYDPTGAATGRLSSSDPNLQNIPVRKEAGRRIRAAFVPDPGFVFLGSDYSQIELRVLAHLCGDPGLIEAFRAGEDIHRHTAARVFDVPLDGVIPEMRRRAKAVNFGILYGMSETRLAREQGMSRADARRFIQAYFDRFAGVRRYIEEVRQQAARDAEVRTLFGRRRQFPGLRERVNRAVREQALRAAVNTTLQGTAADLMKLAMLDVERALSPLGDAARILLQVHDELLIEVREDVLPEAGPLVRRAMEGVSELAVPLVVDQKSGASWAELT